MEALTAALRMVIHARRSCRRGYTGEPIERAVIDDILAAGVAAPSGSNRQAVRFLLETRRAEIERLSRFRLGNEFIAQASALVLVFQDRAADTSGGSRGAVWRQLGYQDAAAAIQNMLLLATAYGLGSCWVSGFANMDGTPMLGGRTWVEALELYGLSPSLEIMGIVVLARVPAGALAGDETHHGRPRARRPLREYLLYVDGVRP